MKKEEQLLNDLTELIKETPVSYTHLFNCFTAGNCYYVYPEDIWNTADDCIERKYGTNVSCWIASLYKKCRCK